MIASVDCTSSTAVCEKQGVSGYPTLKAFDAESGDKGKPYNGGRDLESLKKFVGELKPPCTAAAPSNCSPKELEYLNKMKASSKTELADALARLDKMKDSSMAPALKQWVVQRIAILKDLVATA